MYELVVGCVWRLEHSARIGSRCCAIACPPRLCTIIAYGFGPPLLMGLARRLGHPACPPSDLAAYRGGFFFREMKGYVCVQMCRRGMALRAWPQAFAFLLTITQGLPRLQHRRHTSTGGSGLSWESCLKFRGKVKNYILQTAATASLRNTYPEDYPAVAKHPK